MKEVNVFDSIEGITPIDPSVLKEFEESMENEVIPEIIKAERRRHELAAEFRGFLYG